MLYKKSQPGRFYILISISPYPKATRHLNALFFGIMISEDDSCNVD